MYQIFRYLFLLSIGFVISHQAIAGDKEEPVAKADGRTPAKEVEKKTLAKKGTSTHSHERIIIRVTGYGGYDSVKSQMSERSRLMALRASKLDAYRALAERVYGVSIVGTSTVKDFVMQSDSLSAVIDSVIRGAKVVAIRENKSGSIETVLELTLEPEFSACLTQTNHALSYDACQIPLPKGSDLAESMKAEVRRVEGLYYLK